MFESRVFCRSIGKYPLCCGPKSALQPPAFPTFNTQCNISAGCLSYFPLDTLVHASLNVCYCIDAEVARPKTASLACLIVFTVDVHNGGDQPKWDIRHLGYVANEKGSGKHETSDAAERLCTCAEPQIYAVQPKRRVG